jgi:hypothetical protein
MRVTLKTPEVLARLQEKLKVGTSTKRERLVAILGRLGSDQDGEVLVAARMATKMIAEMDLTWDYVLRQEGDGSVVINHNSAETDLLRTRLNFAQEMLAAAQRERRQLEAEVCEMRRRADEAEQRANMLHDVLARQASGDMPGQGAPKATDETHSREEFERKTKEGFFFDDYNPYVAKPGSFHTTSTTNESPEPQSWEEMKSRWADGTAERKKKYVYSFSDEQVKDMLWTADASQAAEYCLKSKVKWNYEQTLFLQNRVNRLVISGEELARLKVMFASARNANNQHKSGATA